MSKLITALTISILAYFSVGTANNDVNVLIWLASDEIFFQVIRLALITILIAILFTNPPRHSLFRFITGSVAVTTGTFTTIGLLTYTIGFGDFVSIFLASLVIGIAALESGLKLSQKPKLQASYTLSTE